MTRTIGRFVVPALFALVFALPGVVATSAFAQDEEPNEDELRGEMRQVGFRVMTNMVAKGIDPREFMADVMNSNPRGGFDMELLTRKLVENELIDQETIDRLQGSMARLANSRLRKELGVKTDAEWAALIVRIQKVVDTGHVAGVRNPILSMMGLRPNVSGPTQVERAQNAIGAAITDLNINAAEITRRLEEWRAVVKEARSAHVAAQQQLAAACTPRQEAVLMMMGLVE